MKENLFYESRNAEVDAAVLRCINAYKQTSLSEDVNLDAIMAIIITKSKALSAAVKRIKTKSQLEGADNTRDNTYRGFYYLVLGYTYQTDSAIRKAAIAIMSVLNHYGLNIINESYGMQSSSVKSAINDLSTEEMQANLALIAGASQALTVVQESQDRFETLFLAYETDKATESSYANASSLKRDLLKLINKQLAGYLRAMNMIDTEKYGAFCAVLDQIIADSNEIVARRAKKEEPSIEE
ncbi:MAG: DUF6261 family protein [Carboxylicivirga sp.]|jgi:hypothetical protein|nr:DUF6261 family protein [Carboxylicivirga sp.]